MHIHNYSSVTNYLDTISSVWFGRSEWANRFCSATGHIVFLPARRSWRSAYQRFCRPASPRNTQKAFQPMNVWLAHPCWRVQIYLPSEATFVNLIVENFIPLALNSRHSDLSYADRSRLSQKILSCRLSLAIGLHQDGGTDWRSYTCQRQRTVLPSTLTESSVAAHHLPDSRLQSAIRTSHLLSDLFQGISFVGTQFTRRDNNGKRESQEAGAPVVMVH